MKVRRRVWVPYGTLVADPPWTYANRRTGGSMTSGSASQYSVMTLDELTALPVSRVLARDAVVFLWVTVPLLPWGLTVLQAWGAPYRTSLFWHKIGKLGMGFWFRNQVEMLLVGVRGKPTPFRSSTRNVITASPTTHSRKPDEFHRLIEAHAPGPYVELFARRTRPGWTTVGYDVGNEVSSWLTTTPSPAP